MNDDQHHSDGRTGELFDRISDSLSRRGFLSNTAKVGGGAIALSAAGGTAAAGGADDGSSGDSSGEGGSEGDGGDDESDDISDLDVLNFALTLEHLEAAYYNEFLSEYSEHEVETSSVAKVLTGGGNDRYTIYQKIQAVRDHEEAHVEALTKTIEKLGGTPVEPAEYEFPYESIEEFAALSATIEAVGVSAYAGAGPLIENESVLKAALSIHSVEARHTAYFNVLNTTNPFPDAFDEPRTMEEVLEIASQFIVGMEDEGMGNKQMFTVTVENVSKPGTVSTKRADGVVPLSPGAWGVFTGDNPAFMPGEDANNGTELIAEDGFPGGDLPPESGGLADTLAEAENVSDSGTFASPGGTMDNPALFPGESATFTVMASPEAMLTMETMFVQSNDWFYGFEGLSLFDGDEPISGDVTGELDLYDAGTEEDARPGHGPKEPPGPVQKPVQDPMATDVGTDEDEPVQLAAERHPDFDIPDASEVISVTVEPK